MLRFDRPEIKAAATPALLARGSVHVIGLEPLREQAGARWDKIQTGVHGRLEAMLRQQLGPSDFFAPLNDVAYLVTMPSADREDAEVSCLRIAFDLYTSYLGQCDVGGLQVYRAAEGEGDVIRLDSIPRDRIGAIAARAGIPDAVHTPRGQRPVLEVRAAPDERALSEFEPQFLPIWDTKNGAVTSYACVPHHLAFANGTPVMLHDLEARERTKVELICLRQGVAALIRHLERGERFLMTLRVAFDTLSSPIARMEFAGICRDLPSDLRQYLLFELVAVPEGVPQGRLADLMTSLRPYAKALRVQIPAGCHNYFPYQGLALQAIGLDLARLKTSGKDVPAEIMRLSAAARRLAFATFLEGVSDLAALKTARESGAQFLSGELIGGSLPEPRPMTRLSWRDVVDAAAQKGVAA
jgi:hypothetical protein